MTLRTDASSSTINTRRAAECAEEIGSVVKSYPALAALCVAVETGIFLFNQACSERRDAIQVASVVSCFALQKRAFVHEGGHPARDLGLKVQQTQPVGRSRARSGDSMFKDGSSDGFVPTMKQKGEFRHALRTRRRRIGALCANTGPHCLDTFRHSAKLSAPLLKSNCFVCSDAHSCR